MTEKLIIKQANLADAPVIAEFNCKMAMETENLQLDSSTVGTGVENLMQRPEHGSKCLYRTGIQTAGYLPENVSVYFRVCKTGKRDRFKIVCRAGK